MLEITLDKARSITRSALINVKAGADRYQRRRLSIPDRKPLRRGDPEIFFLTPDYNSPSGGIRVIYRHVDILNASGIRAAVVHQRRGFRCNWFDNSTRVLDVGQCSLGGNDLLVLPETDGDLLHRLSPGTRHAIFNQNAHLTWLRHPASVSRHLVDNPSLVGVVTVSQHNADMLSFAFPSLDIHRVHLGIDETLFYDDPAPRGKRMTYMPRRGGEDLSQVLELLHNRGALTGWDVVPLDGLSHEVVASNLRESRIFLAFTYQEGFGLPAAEAMACGNFVIGYHGHGGREFFQENFSVSVDAGDVLGFARQVETAIGYNANDNSSPQSRGRRAAAFIKSNYPMKRETEDVVRIYGALLARATKTAEAAL